MRSRVKVTIRSVASSRVSRQRRRRNSRAMGAGNLGAGPNPPSRGSNADARRRTAPSRTASPGSGTGDRCRHLGAEVLGQVRGHVADLAAPVAIRLGHPVEHGPERRQAVPVRRREVRAAEERLQVRGQEHAQRPAAGPGHGLHRGHVHVVDVGALLAIHLDGHEVAVQSLGERRILERLVGHDVAPMAGGVADGQEDRPILHPSAGQGFGSPRIPVDRVFGVLEQVRARRAGEAIAHDAPIVSDDARSSSGSACD